MKRWHVILIVVLLLAVAGMQFIPPEKNVSSRQKGAKISARFSLPEDLNQILRNSCYDCHSNNTRYPWYADIQPVGWWLAGHIKDGKRKLNFDEFSALSPRRQYRRLKEIEQQLDNNEMPLTSYTLVHRSAVVLPEGKAKIIQWCEAMRDSMRAHFPLDSLERKPQRN